MACSQHRHDPEHEQRRPKRVARTSSSPCVSPQAVLILTQPVALQASMTQFTVQVRIRTPQELLAELLRIHYPLDEIPEDSTIEQDREERANLLASFREIGLLAQDIATDLPLTPDVVSNAEPLTAQSIIQGLDASTLREYAELKHEQDYRQNLIRAHYDLAISQRNYSG